MTIESLPPKPVRRHPSALETVELRIPCGKVWLYGDLSLPPDFTGLAAAFAAAPALPSLALPGVPQLPGLQLPAGLPPLPTPEQVLGLASLPALGLPALPPPPPIGLPPIGLPQLPPPRLRPCFRRRMPRVAMHLPKQAQPHTKRDASCC